MTVSDDDDKKDPTKAAPDIGVLGPNGETAAVQLRMCSAHWEALKKALDDRGLGRFIARDSEALVNRLKSSVGDKSRFEPLFNAHMAIMTNCMNWSGMGVVLDPAKEGEKDRCPLCWCLASCACGKGIGCSLRNWIEYAADDELEEAKRLGLVGAS